MPQRLEMSSTEPQLADRSTGSDGFQTKRPSRRWLATAPSSGSRLGHIGFIDSKGSWQRVVDIFDEKSCREAGIPPFRMGIDMSKVIIQPSSETPAQAESPFVDLDPEGKYQFIASTDNSEHDITLPTGMITSLSYPSVTSMQPRDNLNSIAQHRFSELRIFPLGNSMTNAFIAGPQITLQYLDIDTSEFLVFLKRHGRKIAKYAKKIMEFCTPKQNESRVVCLCHTEFLTRSWKSVHLEVDNKPEFLSLSWQSSSEASGRWILSPVPSRGIIVRSGVGNYDVNCLGELF